MACINEEYLESVIPLLNIRKSIIKNVGEVENDFFTTI